MCRCNHADADARRENAAVFRGDNDVPTCTSRAFATLFQIEGASPSHVTIPSTRLRWTLRADPEILIEQDLRPAYWLLAAITRPASPLSVTTGMSGRMPLFSPASSVTVLRRSWRFLPITLAVTYVVPARC